MIYIMAWRNIWRNKMRSIVIMLSLALGLFAGIAVLALYKGMMKTRVRTVIDAEVGHLQLHDSSFKKDHEPRFILSNGEGVLSAINSMEEVKQASPR
ncbi:MAG TPA: ABC transporter permease, partial [Ferruginibacter sp.]|nr:ABC transporter permease [Ferruginibacter sp.]